MSSPTTLDRLLGAAEAPDWEAVYAAQLPRVYNFFRYRTGDPQLAEDLTATTFEKAWRHRDRYRREVAAFSTWLFAIARNVAADHARRQRPTVPLEAVPPETAEEPAGQPEAAAQRRQTLARLAGLLRRLPERERDLLALKYGAELTNREIARLTGLSESNVGTVLSRAVGKLRAEWEGEL